MDRTTEDKLTSNVSALKCELDNFYLNGLTPEATELAVRICELAGGHSVELKAAELNRRRANNLDRRVQELERKLEAAEALAASYQDGAKFVAKHAADTGSALAQRALDRMEAALARWREVSDD